MEVLIADYGCVILLLIILFMIIPGLFEPPVRTL